MKSLAKTMMVMIISLSFIFFSSPALSESVELRLWSAWPAHNEPARPALEMLQDMINEKGAQVGLGTKYVGGPEVFGPMEGIESLRRGTFELAYTAAPYSTSVIPETDSMKLITTKPWVDREVGIYDLMNEWHKKRNVVYLARASTGQQFQAYLNEERRQPDLSGLTMRTVPIYDPLIKPLGARAVSTAGGEVYTALDRGIVDGFFWGGREIRPWGWHEVTKYIWGPPFWIVDVYIAMNKDAWDALTGEQQRVLTDIMKEYERRAHDAQVELQDEITQELLDEGMEIIEFSEEDEQWYLDMVHREGWKEAINKSARVRELKELVEKHE